MLKHKHKISVDLAIKHSALTIEFCLLYLSKSDKQRDRCLIEVTAKSWNIKGKQGQTKKLDSTALTEISTFTSTRRNRHVISNSKIECKFLKFDIFQIWHLININVFMVRLTRSFTSLHKSPSHNRKYSLAVDTLLNAKLYLAQLTFSVFSYASANCVEMESPIYLPLSA